jgi:hypothetical protein
VFLQLVEGGVDFAAVLQGVVDVQAVNSAEKST